jgi:single-strand DNA-binding protein
MAEGLNRVMLFGNLGADPELRATAGGQSILKFRVATSESYLDKNRERRERTEWHNVVIWGKRAEALAKIISKGTRLFVEGSLRTSSYDDRDGNKRYRTEIIAQNVILSGGGGRGGPRDVYDAPSGGHDFDAPEAGPARGPAQDYNESFGEAPNDDDIPF